MKIAHLAATKSYAYFELWRQKVKGGQELNLIGLAGFLTSRGFYTFKMTNDKYTYIRIVDNIVSKVGKKDMLDAVLDFTREHEPEYIYEFMLKNAGKIVSDDFLLTIPHKEVKFKKDTRDGIQLYYRNCIVKITKDSVKTYNYSFLKDHIWEDQILERDFDPNEEIGSDFRTFIYHITNKDELRYRSLCSIIGFILHNYKDPAYCPAVIFNDAVISDNPEGGTGKGLIVKMIKKFRNMVVIDGKTFDFRNSFLYQRVTNQTEIMTFDDVKNGFDFEKLFSVVTDGIPVNKKGVEEIYIDFQDSPKILITTNYAIKGLGNSDDRRKEEVEIAQYYTKGFTPLHEFGKRLFDDWEESDYKKFEMFIIECCQLYLREGIQHQILVNLPIKKLTSETCPEFIDFMDDFDFRGQRYMRSEFYTLFTAENPGTKWSAKSIFKFVRKYCDFHGIEMKETKSGAIRYFNFGLEMDS